MALKNYGLFSQKSIKALKDHEIGTTRGTDVSRSNKFQYAQPIGPSHAMAGMMMKTVPDAPVAGAMVEKISPRGGAGRGGTEIRDGGISRRGKAKGRY